jgi:hypothetical protein
MADRSATQRNETRHVAPRSVRALCLSCQLCVFEDIWMSPVLKGAQDKLFARGHVLLQFGHHQMVDLPILPRRDRGDAERRSFPVMNFAGAVDTFQTPPRFPSPPPRDGPGDMLEQVSQLIAQVVQAELVKAAASASLCAGGDGRARAVPPWGPAPEVLEVKEDSLFSGRRTSPWRSGQGQRACQGQACPGMVGVARPSGDRLIRQET